MPNQNFNIFLSFWGKKNFSWLSRPPLTVALASMRPPPYQPNPHLAHFCPAASLLPSVVRRFHANRPRDDRVQLGSLHWGIIAGDYGAGLVIIHLMAQLVSMRPVMAFVRSSTPQRTGELCLRSTTDMCHKRQFGLTVKTQSFRCKWSGQEWNS